MDVSTLAEAKVTMQELHVVLVDPPAAAEAVTWLDFGSN
jgi:hypothetical protein